MPRPNSRKKKRTRERARVVELGLRGTWPRLATICEYQLSTTPFTEEWGFQEDELTVSEDESRWLYQR